MEPNSVHCCTLQIPDASALTGDEVSELLELFCVPESMAFLMTQNTKLAKNVADFESKVAPAQGVGEVSHSWGRLLERLRENQAVKQVGK